MIKSALQSSLTNDVRYRSMSAGAVPSNEYLIQTILLSSDTPSIEFTNLSEYSGIYQHLKIVHASASTHGAADLDNLIIRFNSDTAGNYSHHRLWGAGSTPISLASTNATYALAGVHPRSNGSIFGATVIDILDAYHPVKYKTIRVLSGAYESNQQVITLESGSWRSASTISTILIDGQSAEDFKSGSRFSIYGVTA